MSIVNYKCPNCTASMSYNGKQNKMTCEYCGSTFDLDDLEALKTDEKELEAEEAEGKDNHWEGFQPEEWQTGDMEGMKVWNCTSCGAEIIADQTSPQGDNGSVFRIKLTYADEKKNQTVS